MRLIQRLACLLAAFLLWAPGECLAMGQAAPAAATLEGQWQGMLQLPGGRQLRIVLMITKEADGSLTALNYSIDQGPQPMKTVNISLHGSAFHYAVPSLGSSYDGTLSADGVSIDGQWAHAMPLNFARATKETAWEIPRPAPPLKPMTEQNPSFAVATIKPARPDDSGMYFRVTGRRYMAHGVTLLQLMQVAYGIGGRQILGAPAWASEDRFDIAGEPDADGEPNAGQWLIMLQKMLGERFGLVVHHEQRELESYVLTTGSTGSKALTPSHGGTLPSGLEPTKVEGGVLYPARNTAMSQLAQMLQQTVLERPVLDRTGLAGRYDFNLSFMPDETMFHGHSPVATQGAGGPSLKEALAGLGLKLSLEKAPADVIVVDHVQHPSAN